MRISSLTNPPIPRLQEAPKNHLNVRFSEWTGNRSVANIGSNVDSLELPFQSWHRFKEAFAPELIERALVETPGRVSHIVDPCGGSGTTALAAQFFGIHPTTIEVNPFLADLIEAKLSTYDFNRISAGFGIIVDSVWKRRVSKLPVFRGSPKTFIEPGVKGRYIFSIEVATRIIAYRFAIAAIDDQKLRRLFTVLLGSVLIAASNVVVSGKGRRYRANWSNARCSAEGLDELFREAVLRAIFDLRRFSTRRCISFDLLRGDARKLANSAKPCDLVVFSPPYPNSFDYTDVYNVELWALGYLTDRASNINLRTSTVRSHVQVFRDMSEDAEATPTLALTVDALRSARTKLWNRHIPDMVAAYIYDMRKIMRGLGQRLRSKGRVYMIVGDSRYAGIDVPVATILSELAPSIGFELLESEESRSMRVSPQQGGRHELPETLLIFKKCG
jgi:hypothetical protein